MSFGAGLTAAVVPARTPGGNDYRVILFLGALGVWCIVLPFRGRGKVPGTTVAVGGRLR